MKIKKSPTTTSRINKQELFRCGECLHFKQTPHRTHKTVCSAEGVRAVGQAPSCYTPDYTKVIGNIDEFTQVINIFRSKTAQQKKILLGMLRTQATGKKLDIGTKVFFNLRNREYLGNYVSGFVVGYTSSNEIVLAGSPERSTTGRVFFAYLKSDSSLIPSKDWKKKYRKLVDAGRINDPTVKGRKDITEDVKEDNYEVPTIDNAPKGEKTKAVKKVDTRKVGVDKLFGGFSF
jgi:hypothetical protein